MVGIAVVGEPDHSGWDREDRWVLWLMARIMLLYDVPAGNLTWDANTTVRGWCWALWEDPRFATMVWC